jgi:hypothetical protein
MSRDDPIDLTGDSDEEVEQAEIGGASSVVFCMFLRSHRLLAEARARRPSSFIFFPTGSKFSSLASRFGLLPDRTRAQRARENDGESTETWRAIDSEGE